MAKESETNAIIIKGHMNLWSEMKRQVSIINAWKNVSGPGWVASSVG